MKATIFALITGRGSKKVIYVGTAIFALALVVRLLYLYQSSDCPSFEAPIVDAHVYDVMARQLAGEGKITSRFFRQPFFYPFFLSIVYYFCNSSIVCAKVIQVVLGAITCMLGYQLAKKVFNMSTAIIAGVMLAFYGPLIYFQTKLLGESWATFWTVALLLLFIRNVEKENTRYCLLLGLCGALSVITRPTFLPFFGLGLIYLIINRLVKGTTLTSIITSLSVIVTGFALITIPVAMLNYRLTSYFGIMPQNGALSLYIGNNPNAAQTVTARPGPDYERIVDMPLRQGITNPNEQKQFFYERVKDYAVNQPWSFIAGLINKTIHFICSREIPGSESIYVYRQWSSVLAVLVWKLGAFGFPFGLIFPLAVTGLVYHRKKIPISILLFMTAYPASIILVHVCARHRVPIIVPSVVLAAAGFTAIWQMIKKRQSRRLVLSAAAMSLLAAISIMPGPFGLEKINYNAELYYGIGCALRQQGRIGESKDFFAKAVELNPNFAEAHSNLGATLTEQKNFSLAIEHYAEAIRIKPYYANAHSNYAATLLGLGKIDRAIQHYKEALRLEPEHSQAGEGLEVALTLKNKQKR